MAVATPVAGRHSACAPSTLFVPGGRFLMGCELGPEDERPPREIDVRPLRFGRTPVSNMEYAWFLGAGRAPEPPWWKDPVFWGPDQPVVGVTWFEAYDYCCWLSDTFGGHWRLPTEAEWEHAARGGLEAARTAWGAEVPTGEVPEPPLSGPWAVGRGTANGYGLLDVGTIVQEWCHDWYAADSYRHMRRYDPRGPESGAARVSRGGSWRRDASELRPGARSSREPQARAAECGFRVVREVP
jgi:formylglycine-generating enzyme required for sulfatase activity